MPSPLVRPAQESRPYAATSLAGNYVLRGSFHGTVTILPESVVVVIDSGALANSVPTDPPHAPLFHQVRVQVLLAVEQKPSWRSVAGSVEFPVGPYGGVMESDTTIAVPRAQLAFARPRGVQLHRTWLVFRLSGRHTPGSPLGLPGRRDFSTYVCADTYLIPAPGVAESKPRLVTSPLEC